MPSHEITLRISVQCVNDTISTPTGLTLIISCRAQHFSGAVSHFLNRLSTDSSPFIAYSSCQLTKPFANFLSCLWQPVVLFCFVLFLWRVEVFRKNLLSVMFIGTYVFAGCTRTLALYNIWWVRKQTGGCLHKQHVCNAVKKLYKTKKKKTLMNNFKKCYWLPTTLDFCKVFSAHKDPLLVLGTDWNDHYHGLLSPL